MCSVSIPTNEYQEEKCDQIGCNFTLLTGEEIVFKGKTAEGAITVTNYRIALHHNETIFNIPLGVVDSTEVRKLSTLHLLCKDARSYKCTFSTNEMCLEWQRKIEDGVLFPSDFDKVFSFKFYETTSIENPELHHFLTSQSNGLSYSAIANKLFEDEVRRLKFDMGAVWRISLANDDYHLCPSYPRKIIVPSSISDNILDSVARFRSSRRIPAVVWRHPNGAIIARSSQPEVGWLGWRSNEDEDLLKALAEACAYDSPASSSPKGDRTHRSTQFAMDDAENSGEDVKTKKDSSDLSDAPSICDLPEAKAQEDIKKLLIIDARSYATAVANRARGGGCECPEYYPTCEIQFMNLDNIHGIRKSHQALRQLISLPSDIPNWLSLLENTRWLSHTAGLLKAAVTVTQTVALEGRPVLVHCSDGWDRTPQITALAELLMDPYYRTFEGFQVLVEREWIEFGHKFSDRCGCGFGSEDSSERSPIFLQWLDCVYQLVQQFPTQFEFNQSYLVKLSQHVYSNMFGTFLFNSPQKRIEIEQKGKLYSVWSLLRLNMQQYMNRLYTQTQQILYPSCHTKDLQLWKAAYMTKIERNTDDSSSVTQSDLYSKQDEIPKPDKDLQKTKSFDDLVGLSAFSVPSIGRRSSDPNLRENSIADLAMLTSALGAEVVEDIYNQYDSKSIYHYPLNNSEELDEKEVPENESDVKPNFYVNGFIEKCELDQKSIKLAKSLNKVASGDVSSLAQCNLQLCRQSIEGSTDTLVSESGILGGEDSEGGTSIASSHPKKRFPSRDKSEKDCPAGVNQTTAVKPSSKKVNPVLGDAYLCQDDRVLQEDYLLANMRTTFSIAECNSCYQSRKFLNDIRIMSAQLQDMIKNGTEQKAPTKETRHSTPGHSRSPSSGIASTPNNERVFVGYQDRGYNIQSVDGLSNYTDETTRKLEQIQYQHQIEIDILLRELKRAKTHNRQLTEIQNRLNHHNQDNHLEDQVSLPESIGSGSGSSVGQESGVSDTSWEAVEDGDLKSNTLWLPDHAVNQCMGCNSIFWMGRRKHHCRSCGKVFCAECSNHNIPIPRENLHDPVRVCKICFSSLSDFRSKSVSVASE